MMRNAMVFMALALYVTACAAPPAPAPALSPAVSTLSNTLQPTLSPVPSPSPLPTRTTTPIPSITPSPAISLTPAFYFIKPTPTRAPTSELDCRVEEQSVADGSSFRPGERFTVGWKVTNIGTASWFPASIQFVYAGGTKMFLYTPERLPRTVVPGDTIALTAEMRAPKNSSTYTTSWGLRQGDKFFCPMRVTIWVQELQTATP